MSQQINVGNGPRWRTSNNLRIKHVIGLVSKTGATVLWEEGGPLEGGVGRAIIICGKEGEKLSPIYRQKDPWYQAAFPVKEGYHIVEFTCDNRDRVVNIYEIGKIGPYPCSAWNTGPAFKFEKRYLKEIGQSSDSYKCPRCGALLIEADELHMVHPESGFLDKFIDGRPCVQLKKIDTITDYEPNELTPELRRFKEAIEAAIYKATRVMAKAATRLKTEPLFIES